MKNILILIFFLLSSSSAFAIRIYSVTTDLRLNNGCTLYTTTFWLDPDTPQTTSDDRTLGQDWILDCDHEHQGMIVPSNLDGVQIDTDGNLLVPENVKWVPYIEYLNIRKGKIDYINNLNTTKRMDDHTIPSIKVLPGVKQE